MDNMKIGSFIRELRKEKGITQKQLSEKLYITDRAISKWERGLSSPDIALLEPLSQLLGITVSELIKGEREERSLPEREEVVKTALDYSKSNLKERLSKFKKKYLSITAAALILLLFGIFVFLWQSGVFFVTQRSTSPDGSFTATVYSKDWQHPFSSSGLRDDYYLGVKNHLNGVDSYMVFENSGTPELLWSPDSKKLVIISGDTSAVVNFSDGVAFDYRARLSDAPALLGLTDLDPINPQIEYRLLQWGEDSESLLLYYSYIGKSGMAYDGYFWYNCVSGELFGKFEMNSGAVLTSGAEQPLVDMLKDLTARKILRNFDPDDCEEILYRLLGEKSKQISVTDKNTMCAIADALRGMTVSQDITDREMNIDLCSDIIFVMKDDTSYLLDQEKKEGQIILWDCHAFECDDAESEVIGDTVRLLTDGYRPLEDILSALI